MESHLAYIIGVALGDGNLSSPNGRATRLRITCDAKYPQIANSIRDALRLLLPQNAISIVRVPGKTTFFNISIYSNRLNDWMPWKVNGGTKEDQKARVPEWIRINRVYARECLRGLLQTDGSMYRDRGYLMVNFCNNIEELAWDVYAMLKLLGFRPTITHTPALKGKIKYTVRVAQDTQQLIENIRLFKA